MSTAAVAETIQLSPFLERLRRRGIGQTVVLHTGRRTYIGTLLAIDAASVRLEADSDEFDQRCRLEVDPQRIEAVEFLST
jgi:hypothetical protein